MGFDLEVDRFLNATYRDRVLTRERDVMTAGSGFHQALQILASVLAPGAGTVLLDEPDAHLHARLQDPPDADPRQTGARRTVASSSSRAIRPSF